MQDRYVYLSSAGLLLVCVEVAAGMAERGLTAHLPAWAKRRMVPPLLGAMYVSFLAILTLLRAPLWGNNLQLMRQAAEREPDGALPHIFYAKELEWHARELEWNKPVHPPEANTYRLAAGEHVMEGLAKPDAYLYDPFPARILLARNWALSGKHREAIDVLERSMPDPRSCRMISKYGLRHILVSEEPFGFERAISLLTLSEGHYWLGEAHLAWACKAPADRRAALLDRVRLESQKNLQINPTCYEAYALLAKEFLVREALQGGDPSSDHTVARGRLLAAVPQLEMMGREKPVLWTIRPPVSGARISALGCLAMARAAFDAAKNSSDGSDAAQLRDSLAWARRAAEQDPDWGEGLWFQAGLRSYIMKRLPEADRAQREQMQAGLIAALQNIRSDSPRYPQAQAALEAMKSRAR
jgi:hypothetical protein